jgi:hypothetical protein
MKQEIISAIAQQRLLELRYHGYSRIVEPYAYGRDKSGDEILLCYQISGGSESGERVGWKLLKVSEIYAIHMPIQKFQQRSEYKRNDKTMECIFCQL